MRVQLLGFKQQNSYRTKAELLSVSHLYNEIRIRYF